MTHRRFWGSVCLLLLAFFAAGGVGTTEAGPPENPPGPEATLEPGRPGEPISVLIGLYVLDFWGLDVSKGLFYTDFYVWFRWKDEKFDPSGIEYMNAQGKVDIQENEKLVVGDQHYVCLRVRGQFRGNFPLHKYPFDSQKLTIEIEHQMMETYQMVFVADREMYDGTSRDLNLQGREQDLRIAGWTVRGVAQEVDTHRYETDWGHPRPTGKQTDYSRYVYRVGISRVLYPYLLKFLLPLVVIVLLSFLVFFIDASKFGEQCMIGLVAFISAIVFHSLETRSIPDVGYLVVADKFFILSYFVIFLTIVQTVLAQVLAERGATAKARLIDVLSRVLFPILYLVGLLALFFKNLE
ncbi:MAG: hypothetical protein HYZ53_27755 [Planctomycetes bacterium]|nr:hypothetical protein [Planctomycetota bacterium]